MSPGWPPPGRVLAGASPVESAGYRFPNTLLTVDGAPFLANAEAFQTEAFGNASLAVVANDALQAEHILAALEGNLTGTIYSDTAGSDDALYGQLAPRLRRQSGSFAKRQDADRRGREPCHEPRRPLSGHGASRLYGGRHSRGAAPLYGLGVLRQRPHGPIAAGIAKQESNRRHVAAGRWRMDATRY